MWILAAIGISLIFVISLLSWLLSKNPVYKGDRSGSVRPPIEQIIARQDGSSSYGIEDFKAPFVSGRLFQFMVWLSYTRLGYVVLVKGNMKKSKLDLFRGEFIPEKPTYQPVGSILLPHAPSSGGDNEIEDVGTFLWRISTTVNDVVKARNTTVMKKPVRPSILDYNKAYQSGESTPLDVAKLVLAAIKDSNNREPPLRAIIESYDSVVMEMAEASTRRWQEGKPLSMLDGVPVAVKGEMLVEPYPFLCGGTFKVAAMEGVVEGPNISSMRQSGAVIIGIANMQELGKGTLGSNPHQYYQTPRNPYNTNHYCGGSSSGAAACVAAGLCPLALGGDGGGSIRIPASLCGVVGLKPTFELLDCDGGTPLGYTVGVPGPIGSTCLDMAIALSIMDTKKKVSWTELEQFDISGIKVGVYWEYFKHANEGVVKACQKGISSLERLGVEIKDITLPELGESKLAHLLITLAEGASSLSCEIDKHFWDFNLETLTPLLVGLHVSGADYLNSLKQRTRCIKLLQSIFKEVDIIVTPGAACTAPVIPPSSLSHGSGDVKTSGDLMRFAFIANLTGIPGLVVPVGTGEGDLPVGLQLQGPWFSEGLLLRVGRALERSLDQPIGKPDVFYDVLPQPIQNLNNGL